MAASIRYGKANVACYRTYARPLAGLTPIPESAFVARDNTLFATDVDIEVHGDNFLPAYTRGDNRNVVATDTMKNLILRLALEYDGATLEGLLAFLGRRFLTTYPEMQRLRLNGRELPFVAVPVPQAGGFVPSGVLLSRSHNEHACATLGLEHTGDGMRISDLRSGLLGLQLIKLTGSAFASFARDDYTTLPETIDRPLFIYLDVFWTYADPELALGDDPARYIAAEQVRDCVQVVFHEFVSMSIQHLVHEMGQRLLARFPQLDSVSFEAQNRLWDTAHVAESDSRLKVYCDPRPPYGSIGLTLSRDA